MKQQFELTAAERMELRWGNLISMYEKLDRIISGVPVVTAIDSAHNPPAPAWTTLETNKIWFATSLLSPPIDKESIVAATGVNYHELCHVTKTPLVLANKVSERYYQAFNVLEDIRIEREFASTYPIAAAYFTRMIVRYILTSADNADPFFNHLLVEGRDYLPLALRTAVGVTCTKFHRGSGEDCRRANEIVREYSTLQLTAVTDMERYTASNVYGNHQTIVHACDLIVELQKLLDSIYKGAVRTVNCVAIDGANKYKRRVLETVRPGYSKILPAEVLDAINNAVDAVSVDIDADVSYLSKEISHGVSIDNLLHGQVSYHTRRTPSEWRSTARRMELEFAKIYEEKEPGWLSHQAHGKLNSSRAAAGCDPTEAFDVWEDDHTEDVSIEGVVLLDHSGSMQSIIDQASKVVWALKQSVEAAGGNMTAIGFNNSAYVLYRGQSLSKSNYSAYTASGGTVPKEAIKAAHQILATSPRRNKLFVVVTDGAWCHCHDYTGATGSVKVREKCPANEYKSQIKRIGQGATTALFYLGSDHRFRPDPQGCQTGVGINNVRTLGYAVHDLVKRVMIEGTR